jgi:DNA-binding NarL/FixJ family response regulator
MVMPIRVVAIEDHPLMLRAIAQELESHSDIEVVGTAEYGSELHRLVRETCPDVVVLDLGMSAGSFEPVSAMRTLLDNHPDVQILVLTGYDDGVWIRELITAGARGYVLKSDDLSLNLAEGVRTVYRGQRFYSTTAAEKYFEVEDTALSVQELAVLKLAAKGLANRCIARKLNLAEKTVRNALSCVYGKLDVKADGDLNPRVAAVNKALDLGLLED